MPVVEGLGLRSAMLVAGTVGFSLGTAMYIGAALGPGPRDGLMTGIARRGYSGGGGGAPGLPGNAGMSLRGR